MTTLRPPDYGAFIHFLSSIDDYAHSASRMWFICGRIRKIIKYAGSRWPDSKIGAIERLLLCVFVARRPLCISRSGLVIGLGW